MDYNRIKGKFREFLSKLLKDYRLSIYDNNNLTEVYTSTVSRLSIWVILLFISLISVSITLILLFYTPMKRSIPGYPSRHMSEMIQYNSIMVDSLQAEINKRDNYLQKIKSVISGEIIEDTVSNTEGKNTEAGIRPMKNDSIFDELISTDNQKPSNQKYESDAESLTKIKFFPPAKGIVTNKFNASPGHFGTDIVGSKNSRISATLDGTVIFAEWTISTGYVVEIQHKNNLVSIYKHNSDVLVKQGDRVDAGKVIAIMGNEGELSTGPHLHFEIWCNGKPIDAEKYIHF
jgi:murein DD-endopeptidase MepM/ murein hydrolase activator NlpD